MLSFGFHTTKIKKFSDYSIFFLPLRRIKYYN